jgi:hypothetical protein
MDLADVNVQEPSQKLSNITQVVANSYRLDGPAKESVA